MLRLPAALALIALIACVPRPSLAAEPAAALQDLRSVMTERLLLMEGVAQYKWNEGLPVEDLPREAEVLAQTVAAAVAAGLDPDLATRAVAAQIAAAKEVQAALFVRWRQAGAGRFAAAPGLAETLRPEIGRLTAALIAALAAAEGRLDDCAARRALSPLPQPLAAHPAAWALAVQGLLGDRSWCP